MKWTGGFTVHDHGVEGAISHSIAGSLFKEVKAKNIKGKNSKNGYVALELSFDELKNRSFKEIRKGRRRREFVGRPRVDVAVFNTNGWAIAVIEVKRHIGFASSIKDISRISSILHDLSKTRGSIKIGCIVGVRQKSKKQKKLVGEFISDFQRKVENRFKSLRCRGFPKFFNIPKRFAEDSQEYKASGYHAVCFQLRLRNKRS